MHSLIKLTKARVNHYDTFFFLSFPTKLQARADIYAVTQKKLYPFSHKNFQEKRITKSDD